MNLAELLQWIENLQINEQAKDYLRNIIQSDLFTALRLNGRTFELNFQELNIENSHDRLFAKLKIHVRIIKETDDMNLFVLRPFIDKSCGVEYYQGFLRFNKSYYLYPEIKKD